MSRIWARLRIHHLLIVVFAIFFGALHVQAKSKGIGMVTGSKTGTYIRFGRDIAKIAKDKGVDIIVKKIRGLAGQYSPHDEQRKCRAGHCAVGRSRLSQILVRCQYAPHFVSVAVGFSVL